MVQSLSIFEQKPSGVTLSKLRKSCLLGNGPAVTSIISVNIMKNTWAEFKAGIITETIKKPVSAEDPMYKEVHTQRDAAASKKKKKKKKKEPSTKRKATPEPLETKKKKKKKKDEEGEEESPQASLISKKKGDGKKPKSPHEKVNAAAAKLAKDIQSRKNKVRPASTATAVQKKKPKKKKRKTEAPLPGMVNLFLQHVIQNPTAFSVEVLPTDTVETLYLRNKVLLEMTIAYSHFIKELS